MSLQMKRVLIIEDELLVTMLIEDMLVDLGFEPVGPARRSTEAVAMARDCDVAAAVLDVNLNGERSFEAADILAARGIPFVFATGYGESVLPERFRAVPALQKPFQQRELGRMLNAALKAA
jgi:CheY-like chemotaxis protein